MLHSLVQVIMTPLRKKGEEEEKEEEEDPLLLPRLCAYLLFRVIYERFTAEVSEHLHSLPLLPSYPPIHPNPILSLPLLLSTYPPTSLRPSRPS